MKYSLTPERAYKLIESILSPFEIRNKIDDSWEGKWWKLHGDVPERKIIVWDKDGETVFTYDRAYNELTISTKHFNKIISYIPLDPKQLKDILLVLFKKLLDNKYRVEKVEKLNIDWSDKYYLENPLVFNECSEIELFDGIDNHGNHKYSYLHKIGYLFDFNIYEFENHFYDVKFDINVRLILSELEINIKLNNLKIWKSETDKLGQPLLFSWSILSRNEILSERPAGLFKNSTPRQLDC